MSRSAVHKAAHEGEGERAMSSDIAMQMSCKKRVNLALKKIMERKNGSEHSERSSFGLLVKIIRPSCIDSTGEAPHGACIEPHVLSQLVVFSVQSSGCVRVCNWKRSISLGLEPKHRSVGVHVSIFCEHITGAHNEHPMGRS